MMRNLIRSDLSNLLSLSTPLILNLLAYMAMQLVDTIMIGQLGSLPLASLSLANVVYLIIFVTCMGIISAIGTLCAEAYGSGSSKKVAQLVQQGFWIVIFLSIPSMLAIWYVNKFLLWIGQNASVVKGTAEFFHGVVWGILPSLGFISLREFITSISKPKIIITISVLAIPVNALANYILMYGKLGLPKLGIMGVGLATSLVEWAMLIALCFYVRYHSALHKFRILKFVLPRWKDLKRILKLGLPVGISFCVEEFLFVIVAFMMGYIGVVPLAAHQIAIQCMMLAIMIPVGIAQASAVRVSHALGAEQPNRAVLSAYVGIATGFIFGILAVILFWLFGQSIVNVFLNEALSANKPVLDLARKLLIIVAIFHMIDAVQIITNGALRGFQDTLVPMLLGFFSFWLMGIVAGYLLAFKYGFGAVGLWWGLAIGITVAAILLQARLYKQCQRVLYCSRG